MKLAFTFIHVSFSVWRNKNNYCTEVLYVKWRIYYTVAIPIDVVKIDYTVAVPIDVGKIDDTLAVPIDVGKIDYTVAVPIDVGKIDYTAAVPIDVGIVYNNKTLLFNNMILKTALEKTGKFMLYMTDINWYLF